VCRWPCIPQPPRPPPRARSRLRYSPQGRWGKPGAGALLPGVPQLWPAARASPGVPSHGCRQAARPRSSCYKAHCWGRSWSLSGTTEGRAPGFRTPTTLTAAAAATPPAAAVVARAPLLQRRCRQGLLRSCMKPWPRHRRRMHFKNFMLCPESAADSILNEHCGEGF